VSGVVASSPEATDAPFHYSYDYTRKDYSDWENHRITPPFPPLLMPALRNDQTRFAWPLPLGSPGDSVLEANIKLPDGYTAQLPRAVDVKRDFAEYQASYESKKGVLIARRRLVVKLAEVPLAEFEGYKAFRKAIADDQNQYIFYRTALRRSPRQQVPWATQRRPCPTATMPTPCALKARRGRTLSATPGNH
jgi:hypothetical protein